MIPVRRLGAQPISLLDAEPVLFVDHHHAEPLELDGVLQQRVGADHDAGFTGGDLVAHLSFLLRRHRSGQQGHPRCPLGAPELTRHRQWAEHVADRPGMLGGKHFRGSQQCALVAGIDHLQHRQHRDDRLARSHLTLQHPVHRTGRGEFGRTARRAPRAGHWSARTAAVAAARRRARRRCAVRARPVSLSSPYRRATSAHCSPTASSKVSRSRARSRSTAFSARWIARSASSSDIRFRCAQKRFRQRIHDGVEHVEHLTHTRVDVPALHLGAGGIDREELSLERRQQLITGRS